MKKIIFLLFLHFTIFALAQPGTLDTSFNPTDLGFGTGDGTFSDVYSSSIQSDGKIIIGGNFTTYNGVSLNRIARLNANGSVDTSFNPGTGTNNNVTSITIQSDGKIIITGFFTSYNGVSQNRIARLNADGTLDIGFNPGTGLNAVVYSSAIQSDGKIIIGGGFTTYNGITRNRIARLNADGTLDTAFNPSTGANSTIASTAIQSDGKIIIGGSFISYNGIAQNRIARLNADGSLDTSFNSSLGANNYVNSMSIQSDGKIIIGGWFTSFNGTTRNHIARLNVDGSLDIGFDPGTGTNDNISSLSIQSDGKIVIGGAFATYNDISRNYIARLNTDGSLDTGFNTGTGTNNPVLSMSIQPDGKILVGGNSTITPFTNTVYRLNADGSLDTGFNPGMGANFAVLSTAIQSDGKILIGGYFVTYNGIPQNKIARLNTDGSIDMSFNSGVGANGSVSSISIQSDNKIVITGGFISYNGTSRNRIARLNTDGSLDTSFNPGTGANSLIQTMTIQSDGKIVIGGYFNTYDGISRIRVARLNADGSLDTSFNSGSGPDNNVFSLSIQSDGKILIGGGFTAYNGIPQNYISRLNADGSLDTGFNSGVGANGSVSPITIQSDGKILIGGQFTTYNGVALNRIARLNTDGTLDTSFNPGSGPDNNVFSLSIQSDGKILIGGGFTTYNGISQNSIARLNADGSLDTGFNPGTGANYSLLTMSIQPDGKIIIGGYFTSYDGTGRNRITRINGDVPLSVDKQNGFQTKVLFYPNPTKNLLKFSMNTDLIGKEFTVIDFSGKVVLYGKITDEKAIDVTGLSSGIYLVKVEDKYASKFIKE